VNFEEELPTCPNCETEMNWNEREGGWVCPDPFCDWTDV
jgi:tRNA(Ile2) C34 agmatinyltransferase TiaS